MNFFFFKNEMPNLIPRYQMKIECHADVHDYVISVNPESHYYMYILSPVDMFIFPRYIHGSKNSIIIRKT